MNIFLSTPTFDIGGAVKINVLPSSDSGQTRRRVNRVATLDGGVAVNDGGHAEGDRTLTYEWATQAPAVEANIQRLVKIYPRLRVANRLGLFDAVPETYSASGNRSRLTLLVVAKLSGGN